MGGCADERVMEERRMVSRQGMIGKVVHIHVGTMRNLFRSSLLRASTLLQKSKMRRCISSLEPTKKKTLIARVTVR